MASFGLHAQSDGQEAKAEIQVEASILAADKLKNVYVVNDREEILKFDNSGNQLFTYSDKRLGSIQSLDAYNPLKVLAFYRNFNVVVGLDNTLSPVARYDLAAKGFFVVPSVCLAHDNYLWIFDAQTYRLKKLNEQLKVMVESDDLTSLLEEEIEPTCLLESGNRLFLNNPKTGILVFDIYGTYINQIPLREVELQQVINDQLIYIESGQIKIYNLKTLDSTVFEHGSSEQTGLQGIRLQKERLFLLTEKALKIYQLD